MRNWLVADVAGRCLKDYNFTAAGSVVNKRGWGVGIWGSQPHPGAQQQIAICMLCSRGTAAGSKQFLFVGGVGASCPNPALELGSRGPTYMIISGHI